MIYVNVMGHVYFSSGWFLGPGIFLAVFLCVGLDLGEREERVIIEWFSGIDVGFLS